MYQKKRIMYKRQLYQKKKVNLIFKDNVSDIIVSEKKVKTIGSMTYRMLLLIVVLKDAIVFCLEYSIVVRCFEGIHFVTQLPTRGICV